GNTGRVQGTRSRPIDVGGTRSRRSQAVYRRRGQKDPHYTDGEDVRSTSIVHSVRTAAMAPTAASTGAITAPTTPTLSGNSATVRPSCCLMTMRRTLPSCTSVLTASTSWSAATLNDSLNVEVSIPLGYV